MSDERPLSREFHKGVFWGALVTALVYIAVGGADLSLWWVLPIWMGVGLMVSIGHGLRGALREIRKLRRTSSDG